MSKNDIKKEDMPAAEDEEQEMDDMEEKGAYKALTSKVAKLETLLEKAVGVVEKQAKELAALRVVRKESPPEEVDSASEKLDPVDEEEDNEPSPEAATKPAASTTDVGEAFVKMKSELEDLIKKQGEAINQRVEEIRVSVPTPFTFAKGGPGGEGLSGLIRKAITQDRENAGGSYSTTDGGFGWHSGKGNDYRKYDTGKFVSKMIHGE